LGEEKKKKPGKTFYNYFKIKIKIKNSCEKGRDEGCK
jgi:hypothetical protein